MSSTAIPFRGIHPRRRDRDVAAAELTAAILENSRSVHLAHTRVHGQVRLRSRNFDHRLVLRHIEFADVVDMRDCRFGKTVDLRDCIFRKGLILEGTRIRGTLILRGATVHRIARDTESRSMRGHLLRVRGDLLGEGLRARATLDLTSCEIQGNLNLSSRPEMLPAQAGAKGSGTGRTQHRGLARCDGDLRLSVARVGGNVRLRGMRITGSVLADASIVHAGFLLSSLREFPEQDAGSVLAATSVGGDVDLGAAQITGELSLSGAKIGGTVNCQAAEIRGGFFCRTVQGHRPYIGGALHAPSARISAALDLSGAEIGQNVMLEGARVEGSLFFRDGWYVRSGPPPYTPCLPESLTFREPDLRTWIHGSLLLSHVTVTGALEGKDLRVDDKLRLDNATFSGWVSLSRVHLKGDLLMESARVMGGLYCRCVRGGRPVVEGSINGAAAQVFSGVHLSGVQVGGDVVLEDGRIEGGIEINDPGPGCPPPAGTPPVRVGGTLKMANATVIGPVKLNGLHAEGGIALETASVAGALDLTGARIGVVQERDEPDPDAGKKEGDSSGRQAPGGSLTATAARITGGVCCHGVRVAGDLRFESAGIDGGLDCCAPVTEAGVAGERPVIGGSVLLGGATVAPRADFRGAWIDGGLSLERASIGGVLDLSGARIGVVRDPEKLDPDARRKDEDSPLKTARGGAGSFTATGARITGGVRCQGVRVAGDLRFESAGVEGGLDCCASVTKAGVAGERPVIGGSVLLGGATVAPRADFRGAWIDGGLSLERASIGGVLDVSGARIGVVRDPEKLDPDAREKDEASPLKTARGGAGSLTATGARITGGARCQGVRVLGDLKLQSADIEGGLDCCASEGDAGVDGERPVIGGSVLLSGATVAPHADFRAAWIGGGLFLERATIGGMLRLRLADPRARRSWRQSWRPAAAAGWRDHRCTRLGRLPSGRPILETRAERLWRRVSGAVDRTTAWWRSDAGRTAAWRRALDAAGAWVLRPVRPVGRWWSSEGQRAKRWRRGLSAWAGAGSAAARRVLLGRPSVPIGQLDLRNCTVQYLDLQGRDRRCARDKHRDRSADGLIVRLEGCTFNDLSVPGHDFLFLLKRADGVGFRQSNYELVERWLRNQGNEDAAEVVYRSMRAARRATLPPLKRPVDWALGVFRDVAMQFHLLLLAFLLVLAFSTSYVFQRAGAVVVERPLPAVVVRGDTFEVQADGRKKVVWTRNDAFLFALQAQFPMLPVPGVDKWEAARVPMVVYGRTLGVRYDQYVAFLGIIGYLLVPLVVGGIASTWLQRRSAAR